LTYTLSLHDALPILAARWPRPRGRGILFATLQGFSDVEPGLGIAVVTMDIGSSAAVGEEAYAVRPLLFVPSSRRRRN
jgi:hypothetical protein